MFESIFHSKIASFRLGGELISLIPAEMTKSADSYSKKVGDLLVILNFKTVAKDFYHWTVTLRNTGSAKTAQITELYGMDMTQIAAVTPQSTMTLEITVDEQDVATLAVGMRAQVRIDALGGEKHDATITLIGNTGTNNGGSSKYTVELTLNRGENMLSGMTATASVVLSSTDQVLTVPAAALVAEGTRTLIYTGYDEEKETLLNPVEVKTGVSDGQTVQILDGLSEGQTYYYAYYDTLEISYTPDFGSGMFGR